MSELLALWFLAGLPLEDVADLDTEDFGDAEGGLQRGRIFVLFDGGDGLAGHADGVGQLLLGHLIVEKTQFPDVVADATLAH